MKSSLFLLFFLIPFIVLAFIVIENFEGPSIFPVGSYFYNFHLGISLIGFWYLLKIIAVSNKVFLQLWSIFWKIVFFLNNETLQKRYKNKWNVMIKRLHLKNIFFIYLTANYGCFAFIRCHWTYFTTRLYPLLFEQ